MSGAAGHIRHIHECLDLSFQSLNALIEHVASGALQASEKFDGINIMFSYTESRGLVFARGTNDIKTGGLNLVQLSQKFANNRIVLEALESGFKVLEVAINAIFPVQRADAFNNVGQTWYSAEIIFRPAFNLIKYSHNAIIFHESPVLRLGFDGNVRSCNVVESKVFHRFIPKMIDACKNTGWKILGPESVRISEFNTDIFVSELDSIRDASALNYDSTLHEFLYVRILNRLRNELKILTSEQISQVAKRISRFGDYQSLIEIKRTIKSKSALEALKKITDKETEYVNFALAPIEELFFRFSIAALTNCSSALVDDPIATAQEISSLLRETNKFVRDRESLQRHFKKLEMFDSIDIKIEGVVFLWEGKLIKLTGFFAPVNAILGTLKYGR